MNRPELLAPAGNLEKLKAAINFGADAVYLGGSKLNLRAFSDNFSNEELKEGIEFAHSRGKKVYITINIIPHNEDLTGLEEYLTDLYEIGADAIIAADPAIIATAKEVVPNLEIHLSTQANCTNYKSAIFWHKLGVKRIVMARELSLEEFKELREKLPETCEIEAFIHGSMCMAYSGKCLLSNYMTGRDANRGMCAQPCRYKYQLFEERKPGELHEITEGNKGAHIMNSKDLCMIEYIPELMQSGIASFKIEGRVKSSFYVASVAKAYRQAIDKYFENPEKYVFNPKWMEYLSMASHRHFTTGFYFGEEVKQFYENSSYIRDYEIVAVVKDYDSQTGIATLEQRNKVYNGDDVEVMVPEGDNVAIKLQDMKNENGEAIDSTPVATMTYTIKCSTELKAGDMIIKSKVDLQ